MSSGPFPDSKELFDPKLLDYEKIALSPLPVKQSDSDFLISILGASGHGRVIRDIAERLGAGVRGFYDDDSGRSVLGPEYLGSVCDYLGAIDRGGCILGLGDNRTRREVAERCGGLRYATLIHPAAVVAADAEIGEGTVVMAGAIINPGSRIGRHCVINTGAILEHDCVMGDFSSLGPRAVVGGGVRIGEESFIGIGATIMHGLAIGEQTLVGAGTVVVKSLPDRVVAVGVPARVIRERVPGERYL